MADASLGCSAPGNSGGKRPGAGSPLRLVKIKTGMTRTRLEVLVATATGVRSSYRIHSMISRREAQYSDGRTLLIVRFKPGAPAPWVKRKDGKAQHLSPIDATVESWIFKEDNLARVYFVTDRKKLELVRGEEVELGRFGSGRSEPPAAMPWVQRRPAGGRRGRKTCRWSSL